MYLKFIKFIFIILIILISYCRIQSGTIINNALFFDKKYSKKIELFYNNIYDIILSNNIDIYCNFENSVKIDKNLFNYHKYYIFINLKKINDKSLNQIFNLLQINNYNRVLLKNKIIGRNGQLIIGKDFLKSTNRLYINYNENNKYEIFSMEFNNKEKDKSIIKIYKSINKKLWNNLIYNLKELFSEKIINLLLEVIPLKSWDYVYSKNKSNKENELCYYFSFKTEPKLKEIYKNLIILIKEIYKNNINIVQKWYNNYKNNLISWLTLTKSDNNISLSIYICSYGFILDELTNLKYKIENIKF